MQIKVFQIFSRYYKGFRRGIVFSKKNLESGSLRGNVFLRLVLADVIFCGWGRGKDEGG